MKTRIQFKFLNNDDVISAQVSDHHPVIHQNILFWNVMMRGNQRISSAGVQGFNNGFGIVESEKDYTKRLCKVAAVIAEILEDDSSLEVIGLCEGPVLPAHVEVFDKALRQFDSVKKFLSGDNALLHPVMISGQTNWGLMLMVDRERE